MIGLGLMGSHPMRLDPKNRVPFPAPFRKKLAEINAGDGLVAKLDSNGKIGLYPQPTYEALLRRKLQSESASDEDFEFAFDEFGLVFDVTIDSQGRVLLPKELLEGSNLSKDVVLVGMNNLVQVWDKHDFERKRQEKRQAIQRRASAGG